MEVQLERYYGDDAQYPEPRDPWGRPKPKRHLTVVDEKRVRWRMTLDELCYAAGIQPGMFELWADRGILGRRLAQRPDQGRGRHITRDAAQRTVLVARLVRAGLDPLQAGNIVQTHNVRETSPLVVTLPGGIEVTIDRSDLP